jgi:hypothetical protein
MNFPTDDHTLPHTHTHALTTHHSPTHNHQDVDSMIDGDKTRAKVKEILTTGELQRSKALQTNERFRTVQEFLK